jgi:tagatose-1,6-bisphosphate aldolase non-catalytic subunit AgaZ/GatZ
MQKLNQIIRKIIELRQAGQAELTLLAVCPNSAAVLEAAVKTAAHNGMPMLFAATLNQVDTDGGYTGWTPAVFVREMRRQAERYGWAGPLYPCLDHGGPWLKDRHTLDRLSLDETMNRVKDSLAACVEAGYALLHIDPTVDRTLPAGEAVPVETVVARTVELVAHAEAVRARLGLPEISYEVGTEEVHGGLVDESRFAQFLDLLRDQLCGRGLQAAWPCFVVAQVGTDLHTTFFDAAAARKLHATLAPLGSLAKGHYSDWVENPQDYPAAGMGGANVGPEFTAEEYLALKDLERKELAFLRGRRSLEASGFSRYLQAAVVDSGRWKKWLQPEERGLEFDRLAPARQEWLLQTGSRYIWIDQEVVAARARLYGNLSPVLPDPHGYVVDRIGRAMDRYACQFQLFGSLELLGGE